jgi:hypothetical protein
LGTKPVKPKSKKSEKKKLEEECDRLWSKCIIARDKTCRYYNTDSDRLSAHHIRSRTHKSTRWDLDNGICLSWKVHFLQKANPERFQDMVIEIIGDGKYQALKSKSLKVYNYNIKDLEDLKEHLKRKLSRIEAGMDFDNLPF